MNRPTDERLPDAAHVGHLPLRDGVVSVAQLQLERGRIEVDRLTAEVERHQPAVDRGDRPLGRFPRLESKQVRGPPSRDVASHATWVAAPFPAASGKKNQ